MKHFLFRWLTAPVVSIAVTTPALSQTPLRETVVFCPPQFVDLIEKLYGEEGPFIEFLNKKFYYQKPTPNSGRNEARKAPYKIYDSSKVARSHPHSCQLRVTTYGAADQVSYGITFERAQFPLHFRTTHGVGYKNYGLQLVPQLSLVLNDKGAYLGSEVNFIRDSHTESQEGLESFPLTDSEEAYLLSTFTSHFEESLVEYVNSPMNDIAGTVLETTALHPTAKPLATSPDSSEGPRGVPPSGAQPPTYQQHGRPVISLDPSRLPTEDGVPQVPYLYSNFHLRGGAVGTLSAQLLPPPPPNSLGHEMRTRVEPSSAPKSPIDPQGPVATRRYTKSLRLEPLHLQDQPENAPHKEAVFPMFKVAPVPSSAPVCETSLKSPIPLEEIRNKSELVVPQELSPEEVSAGAKELIMRIFSGRKPFSNFFAFTRALKEVVPDAKFSAVQIDTSACGHRIYDKFKSILNMKPFINKAMAKMALSPQKDEWNQLLIDELWASSQDVNLISLVTDLPVPKVIEMLSSEE